MSFTMKTLTEGIRQRHMGAQHQRLTEKWNRTGLLRGLTGYARENMSVMLENQAAQLLRETNTLGSSTGGAGDIRGFQNVAFPIVRRVFGGLVANELVSVQPMSLPSGLLFYLDYTYGTAVGGEDQDTTSQDSSLYTKGQSIYNNPPGKGIRSGSLGVGGQYDLLGSGYSRVHETVELATVSADNVAKPTTGNFKIGGIVSGLWTSAAIGSSLGVLAGATKATGLLSTNGGGLVDFDAAIASFLDANATAELVFGLCLASDLTSADLTMLQDCALVLDEDDVLAEYVVDSSLQGGTNICSLRRHTKRVDVSATGVVTVNPLGGTHVLFPMISTLSTGAHSLANGTVAEISFVKGASLNVDTDDGSALTIPSFEHSRGDKAFAESPTIPEIDIKIESLAVTAVSRKLKAKWSPELAQDLNAYHSLDAEVELTQILSEQIALELDREVLNDLLVQANGANLFWSRAPGNFVNKLTGKTVTQGGPGATGPHFTGTVRDWYETLVETIIDAGNIIHRKTLRGSANFIVIGPDVATIFESSIMYKPSYSIDGQGQTSALSIGAEKIGNLSNRFTVYKDPYFPRNKVLVGYKGGSYLETGYVYAPYVPLIVTPTIFAPEDFTPRKGVMTRYGKKMVRSDFYGTVTCLDMNII
jgi:hypothetical protein